jgi:hypothetical protein
MADASRQIVEKVIAALTGLPTTGDRVSDRTDRSVEAWGLPCLRVIDLEEEFSAISVSTPRVYERNLQIEVQAIAMALDDVSATLDQICLEAKHALARPLSVAGIGELTLTRKAKTIDHGAEQSLGRVTLSYTVQFFTSESAQDVIC